MKDSSGVKDFSIYFIYQVNRLDTSFLDGLKLWRMFLLKDHLYFLVISFKSSKQKSDRLSDNSSNEVRPKIPGVSSKSTFDRLLQRCVG